MRSAQAGAAIVRAHLDNGLEDTDAAFAAASNIPLSEERISALALVASAQARKGQKEKAQSTIKACQNLIQDTSADYKPWGKLSLAAAEYELGHRAQAAQLCDQAIGLTGGFTIHPERERALLFLIAARLRASFGDETGALATVKRSGQTSLFDDVAQAEAEAGLKDSALKWIARLKDPEQKASALLGVVRGELDRQQQAQLRENLYPRCKSGH